MATGEELAAQLKSAIELGELSTTYAPGGHPLYQALDDARALLAYLQDAPVPIPDLPASARVPTQVAAAIEALAVAEANLRVDPGKPLPATIWPQIVDKWPWIAAAGVGALLLYTAVAAAERDA